MEHNKTSKYLKYAIGEIILVVIGILIALQINNWNERRKLYSSQMAYLEQLYEDISFMQEGYEKRLNTLVDNVKIAHKGLAYAQNCINDESGKSYLDTLLLRHQLLSGFYSLHDTYDEMLSANVLASLTNKELKNDIKDLYTTIDFSNSFIPYFRADLGRASDIIWKSVSFGYDSIGNLTVDYKLGTLCNDIEFKNALVEVIDSREDYLGDFEGLLKKIKRTKTNLEAELKN